MELVRINVQDAVHLMTLTVKVTGIRRFRARMWLGVKLIQLAGRIVGFGTIDVQQMPTS